ncbi:MAG: electron transfer flavoprotein beta subunit/FixA family protein [Actinobacteria bacterium]|nr:electron transfer flavoprotein beta subunit/FixA family protein [Actinomycetota bacterium]
MKIVVCVKQVPDLQSDRSMAGGRLVRGEDDVLNELDEYAVEAAVALAESLGGTVTAVTMGPSDANDALRRALQMGADDALHVADDALAGADVGVTARVLAAAVRHLEEGGPIDLVVTGMATMDSLTSMLPDALAAALGLPALTLAAEVECDGTRARITRTIGDHTEVLSAPLPLLLSVTDQANEPQIPNFAAMKAARRRTVRTVGLAELGLDDVRPATAVLTAVPRPPRAPGTIISDTGDGGARLAAFLRERLA